MLAESALACSHKLKKKTIGALLYPMMSLIAGSLAFSVHHIALFHAGV